MVMSICVCVCERACEHNEATSRMIATCLTKVANNCTTEELAKYTSLLIKPFCTESSIAPNLSRTT